MFLPNYAFIFPITLHLTFTYLFAQPQKVFDFDMCDNPLKLWKWMGQLQNEG